MITFSASFVNQFVKKHPELRYGQEFHQWARLERICGSDKAWCDRLYQLDGTEAIDEIESRIDFTQ